MAAVKKIRLRGQNEKGKGTVENENKKRMNTLSIAPFWAINLLCPVHHNFIRRTVSQCGTWNFKKSCPKKA